MQGGPQGIRVVCLRSAGSSEAPGVRRLPTLTEVANAAAFTASDQASAMTGTVANLTCGSLVDEE
jgi:enoyl-[acyl-carrier-protein] reductase (NADH)